MEPSFLETFIINAAAERHFVNPGMAQFQQIIQKIETTFGTIRAIPSYPELENATRPHIDVLSQREAQAHDIGRAAQFVVNAVKSFVQTNNL